MGKIRCRAHRRGHRCDQHHRRPRTVPPVDGQDRRGNRPVQDRPFVPQGQGDRSGIRFPAVHPPLVHLGRYGCFARIRQGQIRGSAPTRSGSLAHPRSTHRQSADGLERIRVGTLARQERQRDHHHHHRKPRPDGYPHRRLDHHRAGHDPLRPHIPAHARHGHPHDARHRQLLRRVQRTVCRLARRKGRDRRHRDQSARIAFLVPGLESLGIPHRKNRDQTGHRLYAGRTPEPDHQNHLGALRTDPGLRHRQDPPLELRQVRRCGPHPGFADEVGGRGDGHRTLVPGSHPESCPIARDQTFRHRR